MSLDEDVAGMRAICPYPTVNIRGGRARHREAACHRPQPKNLLAIFGGCVNGID